MKYPATHGLDPKGLEEWKKRRQTEESVRTPFILNTNFNFTINGVYNLSNTHHTHLNITHVHNIKGTILN